MKAKYDRLTIHYSISCKVLMGYEQKAKDLKLKYTFNQLYTVFVSIADSTGTWNSSCQTNSLGTEAWLKNSVTTQGPVTIGFVVVYSFFYYTSGIYYDSDSTMSSVNYAGLQCS